MAKKTTNSKKKTTNSKKKTDRIELVGKASDVILKACEMLDAETFVYAFGYLHSDEVSVERNLELLNELRCTLGKVYGKKLSLVVCNDCVGIVEE